MKISAVSWSVNALIKSGDMDLERFVDLCGLYGLDGVELLDVHVVGATREARREHLGNVKKALGRTGLTVSAYMASNDFTDEGKHDENLRRVREVVAEARFLGADKVRILGGATWELNGRSREDGLASAIKGLQKAVAIAAENSMTFALENHGDLPGRSEEVLRVLAEVNSPWLKVCCDIGNFIAGNMAVKEPPLDGLKKLLPHVVHVHVKDRRFAPGERGDSANCVIGTGNVPLADCLRLLHASGYAGFLSCECEGEKGIKPKTAFMNSVANVKTAVEKYCQ